MLQAFQATASADSSANDIAVASPPVQSFLRDNIPPSYYKMPLSEVWDRGMRAQKRLGDSVFILAHHYQRDETFVFGDASGDSLKLAQLAAQNEAEYILFCGVHFMAESADILTSDRQKVILPNLSAGCSLADTADIDQVEECWEALTDAFEIEDPFIPITYINSAANLKAFCGKHGGIVCTSSNADKILDWALSQNKPVLFFPDQHLGRNTANSFGIPRENIRLWDRHQIGGGLSAEELKNTRVLLWNGLCSVHGRFNSAQIEAARKRRPGIKVIVHPECTEEVVAAADYSGSTSKIIKTIEESPDGSQWAVGTEINMVNRLHKKLSETRGMRIECLNSNVCLCSTMYRTHPANVLWILDNLLEGKIVNQIVVPPETAKYAKIALNRMLELS